MLSSDVTASQTRDFVTFDHEQAVHNQLAEFKSVLKAHRSCPVDATLHTPIFDIHICQLKTHLVRVQENVGRPIRVLRRGLVIVPVYERRP